MAMRVRVTEWARVQMGVRVRGMARAGRRGMAGTRQRQTEKWRWPRPTEDYERGSLGLMEG